MTPDKTMDVQQLAEHGAKTLANECARLRGENRDLRRIALLATIIVAYLMLVVSTGANCR